MLPAVIETAPAVHETAARPSCCRSNRADEGDRTLQLSVGNRAIHLGSASARIVGVTGIEPAKSRLQTEQRTLHHHPEVAEDGGHDPHTRRYRPVSTRCSRHREFIFRVADQLGVEPDPLRGTRCSRPLWLHSHHLIHIVPPE